MSWSLNDVAYRNQVLLATAGNAYGPQFGPANPPSYYDQARILDCGHSEEDCDSYDCGFYSRTEDERPVTDADIPASEYTWADR